MKMAVCPTPLWIQALRAKGERNTKQTEYSGKEQSKTETVIAVGSEDDSRSVQCPVCLSSMVNRTPRALSCLHTFCESCLTRYANGGKHINCPTCRKSMQLPRGGVAALPVNFYIQQLAAKLQPVVTPVHLCQTCDDTGVHKTEAVQFCADCESYFCDSCTTRHEAIPAFTKHELRILESPVEYVINVMCASHKRKLSVHCKHCLVFICNRCALGAEHEGHESELQNSRVALDDIKQSVSPKLDSLIKDVKEKLSKIDSSLQEINEIKTLIRQEGERQIDRIKEEVKSFISEVEQEHEAELLSYQKKVSEVQNETSKLYSIVKKPAPETEEQLEMINSAMAHLESFKDILNSVTGDIKCNVEFHASTEIPHVGTLISGQLLSAKSMNTAEPEKRA